MLTEINQRELLVKLANTKMPYGKYKGKFIIDLPEHYVVWYNSKGFPEGKFGDMLRLVYEIKLNGLEDMIRKLKK